MLCVRGGLKRGKNGSVVAAKITKYFNDVYNKKPAYNFPGSIHLPAQNGSPQPQPRKKRKAYFNVILHKNLGFHIGGTELT